MTDIFTNLDQAFATGGTDQLLATAEEQLRKDDRFHELFEVLKMQTRGKLGLPLLHQEAETLSEDDQRTLENGLLDACREVGMLMLRAGQIQEGWVYLRHLSDNGMVLSELVNLEVNQDNLDQVLGLLLHEGLDTERGFQLVLENYGTCNAITTIQSALYGRSQKERQAAGRLLVAHVHAELLENAKAHVEREEGKIPQANRLTELMEGRDFLFADGAYHIDTSHLSSTVQIANELVDAASLKLALDLAKYGQHLDKGLQYPGDPPFEDTYAAHQKLFEAQLGINVDASIDYFAEQARSTDAHQQGTFPIEVYIDLLARLGRLQEASEASIELIPPGIQTTGRAPSLFEISQKMNDFAAFQKQCRERTDVLGYLLTIGK